MSEAPVIETRGLRRTFVRRERRTGSLLRERRDVVAVDDLSVTVSAGESVGYIGANGAGKSTTIKLLVGILVPSAGTVRTCGLDPVPDRIRLAGQVGVVFGQRSQLWWDLPVAESFDILAAVHGLSATQQRERQRELVAALELEESLSTPVRQLSLGQRMRAEVAAALLHRPRVVILDEPTIGLDVLSKERLREFLRGERTRHGTTLLLTTHDMGDVERLCDRVLVIDQGRLAYDGSLPGLAATVAAERLLTLDLLEPVAALPMLPGVTLLGVDGHGIRHRLAIDPTVTTAGAVLAGISASAQVRDLSIAEPDIEDVVKRIYRSRR